MEKTQRRQTVSAAQTTERTSILLIDDEAAFGRLVKLNLEQYGLYAVDLSHDGEDGLEKIRKGRYDLVILDLLMPRMEGHEVLRRIQEFSRIPVIIISAYIPPQVEQEIRRRGAAACLSKPVSPDAMILAIHRALSSALPQEPRASS